MDRTTIFQLPTRKGVVLNQYPRGHLVHCLRVAATRFDEDAQQNTRMPDYARLFYRYAAEARELADRIEAATFVEVGAQRKWKG